LLDSAGGLGKEFRVGAGTDADGEKSNLHARFLLCFGVPRMLLGDGFLKQTRRCLRRRAFN